MNRVVFVCPSIGGGGAERVAVMLASAFVHKGFQVYFYHWEESFGREYELDKKVKLCRPSSRSFFSRVIGLRSLIKREKIGVVYAFTDVPNIIGWLACYGMKMKPEIFPGVHSDLKVRDHQVGLTIKTILVRSLHRWICRRSQKVVTVSNGAKTSLERYYGLPPSKVICIYNPVLQKVSPIDRIALPANPLRIVSAGRLTLAKNYPQLLKSIKCLHDRDPGAVTLDIFGEGELRGVVQDLIESLELTTVVTIKGFIPDLAAALHGYDVFVMSSRWEGFGNVLVEALNAGLRVVSTDCPSGPSEILADGKYGRLVAVDDVEALAKSIVDVARDELGARSNLVEHLQQFTVSTIADQYISLIKDSHE